MPTYEVMDLLYQLQSQVLALETIKSNQALEIKSLKRRVKSLENRRKSRTLGFKRLRKVGSASRVKSSNNVNVLEEQEKEVVEKEVSAVIQLLTVVSELEEEDIPIRISKTNGKKKAKSLYLNHRINLKLMMIVKEEKFVYFQLIRADGSSKRYLTMIKMLQNIDREDFLENPLEKMKIKFKGGLLGLKDFKMILRVTTAQLQLLSDYYCWKDYADRDEIKD
ncbi:hypothetical protein Tco_0439957 [Tanacetum coccineum]